MSRIILTLTCSFSQLPLRVKFKEFMLLTHNCFCSIILDWKHLFCLGSENEAVLCLEKENVDGFALKWSYLSELVNEGLLDWVVTVWDWKQDHKCSIFMLSHLLGHVCKILSGNLVCDKVPNELLLQSMTELKIKPPLSKNLRIFRVDSRKILVTSLR